MARAQKGSQFHLQEYINDHRREIDNAIYTSSPSLLMFADPAKRLQWISPLADDNYAEYRDDFLTHLIEDEQQLINARKIIREHWPARGPVWDGLAIVKGKNNELGIILVEAKAYPEETVSRSKASSDSSEELIRTSLTKTQKEFGSVSELDTWLNKYYQLANRLCFLTLLSRELNIPTWLVLINFTDDTDHRETSLTDWKTHYAEVFDALGLQADAPLVNRIALTFMPPVTATRKLLRDTDRMVGLE